MNTFVLLALFSGIAVTACLFAACYFFFVNNERLVQISLGVLFFSLALRIGKSIFYYLIPEMSLLGISIGFLGLSMTGPALWMHSQFSTDKRQSLRRIDLLHLLIPVIGFSFIVLGLFPQIPTIAYTIGTGVLLVYVIASWFSGGRRSWNYWLMSAVSLIWVALAYQLISDTILDYAYGAALAALMVYVLIFRMLKNPAMFQKSSTIRIAPELINRVIKELEDKKLYQQPSLSLSQFSLQLNEPVYLVSKAIKRHYGRSFPEVVNALRVEEVKRRLNEEKSSFNKVEGMAYDVGFNTPSAFYAAFKKETSSTPRAYQKAMAEN
ncbi:MAG: AraC family transcriptional regulator [Cyclobacteriaceae bacterium]